MGGVLSSSNITPLPSTTFDYCGNCNSEWSDSTAYAIYANARMGNPYQSAFLIHTHGIDTQLNSKLGTALHFAALEGDLQVGRLLLAHSAKVNARSQDNSTPLHCAVRNEHHLFASILLAKHAEVDLKDNEQCTPLYRAVENGDYKNIVILIRYGANIHEKCKNGQTPLELAKSWESKNPEKYSILMAPFRGRLQEYLDMGKLQKEIKSQAKVIKDADKKYIKQMDEYESEIIQINKKHFKEMLEVGKTNKKLEDKITMFEHQVKRLEEQVETLKAGAATKALDIILEEMKSQRKFAEFVQDNLMENSAELDQYVKKLDDRIVNTISTHAETDYKDWNIAQHLKETSKNLEPNYAKLKLEAFLIRDYHQNNDNEESHEINGNENIVEMGKDKTIAMIKRIRPLFPDRDNDEIFRNLKTIQEQNGTLKNLSADEIVSKISEIKADIGKLQTLKSKQYFSNYFLLSFCRRRMLHLF